MLHSNQGIEWSQPDPRGICTLQMDVGAKSTVRGKRRRRAFRQQSEGIALWSSERKLLLKDWVKGVSANKRWNALLKAAGSNRFAEANDLMQALLEFGWIEVQERRVHGRWEPVQVDFLALEPLRELLGLKNRDKLAQQQQDVNATKFSNEQLELMRQELSVMPPERAVKRYELLLALSKWQEQQYFGSRRDFSQFARGQTKAVSSSEWKWLSEGLDLNEWNIDRHTATLYISGSICLHFADGDLDLKVVPDFIALTPETIKSIQSISNNPLRWIIVENQTCFEKLARQTCQDEAVLWVPGHPPTWWKEAVARFVSLCPVPAKISCDPDPAGIQIALTVGQIWNDVKCQWEPWKMSTVELQKLKHGISITDKDRVLLDGLLCKSLPVQLLELATEMKHSGTKGEQEELFFSD